jgi:hypothetical protein
MSIGEKIADSIPEPAMEYVREHPRVLFAITVPLMFFSLHVFVKSVRLQVMTEHIVANRASEMAQAASEALGG